MRNDEFHVEEFGIARCDAQGGRLTCDLDGHARSCLLYTSDAADERSSVDLGGRRIIKKKKQDRLMNTPEHNIAH